MPTFEASRDPYPTPERIAVVNAAIALARVAARRRVPSHVLERVVRMAAPAIDRSPLGCEVCGTDVPNDAVLCAVCDEEYCVVCEAPLSIAMAGGACDRCLDEFFGARLTPP